MQTSIIIAIVVVLASGGMTMAPTANKGLATPQGNSQTDTSKSGSGSSSSGGRDANGNQGRDAMPESNINVKPLDQQNKQPNGMPKEK